MSRSEPGSGGLAACAWRLVPLGLSEVACVADIERRAHLHPWSERQLADSVTSGHWCQVLLAPAQPHDPPPTLDGPRWSDGSWVLGYGVAMAGYRETHLLNLITEPTHRRQGVAGHWLRAWRAWSQQQQAESLWLEVRAGNVAARSLYEKSGFQTVGVRRGYYPAQAAQREDALVMRLSLGEEPHGD